MPDRDGEGREWADEQLAQMRFRSQGLEVLLTDLFGGERWKDSQMALAAAVEGLDVCEDPVLVRAVVEHAAVAVSAARSMDRWLVSGGVRPSDW